MPTSCIPGAWRAAALARCAVGGLVLALAGGQAGAERADRNKDIVIEADKDAMADRVRQVVVYSGNAVLSQGSLVLRADRIETRETPDGYRVAAAVGSKAQPATWRERLDGSGEIVEGRAERVDYDGRADRVRLSGGALLRRLRDGKTVEEISGSLIVWDNAAAVFSVEGGATSPINPTGRVRTVLSPRVAPSASAPAAVSSPAATNAPAPQPLAPVRSLEGPR